MELMPGAMSINNKLCMVVLIASSATVRHAMEDMDAENVKMDLRILSLDAIVSNLQEFLLMESALLVRKLELGWLLMEESVNVKLIHGLERGLILIAARKKMVLQYTLGVHKVILPESVVVLAMKCIMDAKGVVLAVINAKKGGKQLLKLERLEDRLGVLLILIGRMVLDNLDAC